jgi:hypothetical protein
VRWAHPTTYLLGKILRPLTKSSLVKKECRLRYPNKKYGKQKYIKKLIKTNLLNSGDHLLDPFNGAKSIFTNTKYATNKK